MTKQTIWERKLLDFSLRNNLINCKLGRRVIPFVSFSIDKLEDNCRTARTTSSALSRHKAIEPTDEGMYDSSPTGLDLSEKVVRRSEENNIVSYLSEKELKNALKFVYRASRTSMEENGANSLFLTLGILKWYETPKSVRPRYAPIVLMPVDIIRKSGNNYVLRTRDEESIVNTTLLELLKQQFKINFSALTPLPKTTAAST